MHRIKTGAIYFYIPITFNNPIKASFSNKKYPKKYPNTPDTNCKSMFLIEKPVFNGILKIIGAQIRTPHTQISNLYYPYCTLNPNQK